MLIIFSKTLSYVLVNSLLQDEDVNVLALFQKRDHSGDPSSKCLTGFGKDCLVEAFCALSKALHKEEQGKGLSAASEIAHPEPFPLRGNATAALNKNC